MGDRQVRVRPAGPDDRDQVWPLARDLATSFRPERPAFERSFGQLLNRPEALLLVAGTGGGTAGGAVIGYLLATSHPAFHANGPVAWVEEVMVAEHARGGTGVGRRLMAAAEDWARAQGAPYLALATRRAAPFYQALGYSDSAVYFRKTLG